MYTNTIANAIILPCILGHYSLKISFSSMAFPKQDAGGGTLNAIILLCILGHYSLKISFSSRAFPKQDAGRGTLPF